MAIVTWLCGKLAVSTSRISLRRIGHRLIPMSSRRYRRVSDKDTVRDHILVFVTQVPPLLRFKSDEERTPVYCIVEETFAPLLNIFSRLVQIPNPTLEVAAKFSGHPCIWRFQSNYLMQMRSMLG